MENCQQMTGDILRHVSGQGPVYVMATQELSLWNKENDVIVEQNRSSSPSQQGTLSFSRNADQVSPTVECTSERDSVLTNLQQIFPSKSREEIADVTRSCSSLEDATNRLLDCMHAENILQQRERKEAATYEVENFPLQTVLKAEKDPFTAMVMFRNQILKGHLPRQTVIVNRQSGLVVRDFFKLMKRGEIDIRRELDVEFFNEDGIDANGLTKEYLNLVMTGMATGKGGLVLFEGAPDHLLPVHKEEYLQSGYFDYVGKAISLSVVHGGVSFLGMSRALARYLTTGEITDALPDLTLLDVPDLTVQMCLEEIESAIDDSSLQLLQGRDDIQLLLTQAGFVIEFLTMTSKARAVQHVLLHQVFKARRDEIDAIRRGMDSINLTDFLIISPSCIPLVFPLSSDVAYTPEDVIKSIKLDRVTLSLKQIEVADWFNRYINELEGEQRVIVDNSTPSSELSAPPTLKQLIQFIFGDPVLPTNSDIKITFRATHFPDANSCFGIVHLPLEHEEYSSFKASMNTCINCQYLGYGRG